MPEKEKNSQPVISVCPKCGGSGEIKLGFSCVHCQGVGLAAGEEGKLLFWGKQFSIANIRLERLGRKIDKLINFFGYAAGITGFLALGFWIWSRYSSGFTSPEDFYIWREKGLLLIWFWISLIFDMFIIYRISEEKRKQSEAKIEKENSARKSWTESAKLKKLANKLGKPKLVKTDVSKFFGRTAQKIIEDACLLAARTGGTAKVKHLLLAVLNDEKSLNLMLRLGANLAVIKTKLEERIKTEQPGHFGFRVALGIDLKKALIEAYFGARKLGKPSVEPIDLILPIVNQDQFLEELFYDMEIDRAKISNGVGWFDINEKIMERWRRFRSQSRWKPATNMNRSYTAMATPLLDNFGYDLTIAAKWGKLDNCVAREDEIAEAFRAIDSGRLGVLLVGPDGAGKKTIIHGIAALMAEEAVPKLFRDKRLIEIDASRLIAGATASQAQERLNELIAEANRSGNIILAIHDIENITGISAGSEQSMELSEVLANAIDRKFVILLATATPENYSRYIENRALGRAMAKVEVNEPKGAQAIKIISSKIGYLEGRFGVYFSYAALEQAIELTSKYMHDTYLPAKAVQVLEMAASRASGRPEEERAITKQDISQVVSEITHIPASAAAGEESAKLLRLEEEIHKYMINQSEAVTAVAASLRRARAQMTEGKRPIASFLFLGPTGVGKTELAKSIARVYFGDEKCMIRLDMSEYQIPESVNNLVGAEGRPGHLTEAVRKAPFSLILLDEFEKAYKDILNIFLQVMDDGRLTDGEGRTVDFTNSIIIATSNAGAVYIQDAFAGLELEAGAEGVSEKLETKYEEVKETLVNEHLNKIMRPELINRFDGLVVFKPLTEANVIDITRLMVKNLGKRLTEKGIGLNATDEGIKILAHEGFDPKFGARPLRRLLQDKIENLIANKILAGELKRRDQVVINERAEVDVVKARGL